jgi:5-methyltetrahydropteroyltriglutamate--homocysteine methyltransferase
MARRGVTEIPSNDFSLYDTMLDAAVAFGAVPKRYRTIPDPLRRYFAMARGAQDPNAGIDLKALEMTKWFDTNYHYLVPEIEEDVRFGLDGTKLFAEIAEARALGLETRPVFPGPVTFLLLSKMAAGAPAGRVPLDHLEALLVVYEGLFAKLAGRGVAWVQLDEPALVTDLDERSRKAYRDALGRLARLGRRPKVMLTTYFGALNENLSLAVESGLEGLHVDLVRAPGQLAQVLNALPQGMILSAGVVDGRNIWRTDLDAAYELLRQASEYLGEGRVVAGTSCSLLHVPVDLEREKELDPEVRGWMAFALQKVDELNALARALEGSPREGNLFGEARTALAGRAGAPRTFVPDVRTRMKAMDPAMLKRKSPYALRSRAQRERLALPLFPTTTIGSFPQTTSVRYARAARRSGKTNDVQYGDFLRYEIRKCVEKQDALGLDVLVHGEFERNDMVEYFGERLEGFAFTENGWVQSYGSRCVKPPVLFGDVSRREPMTVQWSSYAQEFTRKPVKGMLTGPVTILQWSFVRNDQPRSESCLQIALALRDEVRDLEAAGLAVVQVDEPAVREGLPLRAGEQKSYLKWAVDAFRLATSGVRDETQIHTHMCYCEFGSIFGAIAEMDADVITLEAARSRMELLEPLAGTHYPNEIGPGVYDIHSPRVPTVEEMVALLEKAAEVLPAERLWVNPDCGLKTRDWPETEASLANMVAAAGILRQRHGTPKS